MMTSPTFEYGGKRFLTKPVDIDDVLSTVDEVIGKAQATPLALDAAAVQEGEPWHVQCESARDVDRSSGVADTLELSMPQSDHRGDRLSPQTVHELLTLLTAIRGQEHMVRRWVRLRDTSDGCEKTLERLAMTDALIQRLAAEILARARADQEEPKNS